MAWADGANCFLRDNSEANFLFSNDLVTISSATRPRVALGKWHTD